MKITHILAVVILGGVIGGCETTGADKAGGPSPSMNREFVDMYGGQGEVHKYSGLQCASALSDMTFNKSVMFNPNGQDVGCNWQGGADDRYLTVYATRYPDMKFSDYWRGALATVASVEKPRGLSLDQEKSQDCTLGALISVAAADDRGTAKSTGVFSLETAVFTSDETTSVVTTHPAAGGWIVKVRSTRPTGAGRADKNHYVEMCLEASELTQTQSANIARAGWK